MGIELFVWTKWLALMGLISLVSILLLILAIPWLICSIPTDYFVADLPSRPSALRHYHYILFLLRNVLGGLFVLIGIVLLFLPGQGLITIILGLLLMQFPGKYRLERWLIRKPGLLKTVNWLRIKRGCDELVV